MKDFPFSLNIPKTEQVEAVLEPSELESQVSPEALKWGANVMSVLRLKSKRGEERMLAGAISTAILVKSTGSSGDQEEADTLLQDLVGFGRPPWKDKSIPMKITGAKVYLDMLSVPEDKRRPTPLGKGEMGNQSKAFWIDRKDPDGEIRHSFICKATTAEIGKKGLAPSGGALGGEVVREALSGFAAGFLQSIGIDIGMPETHVVELPGTLVGKTSGDKIICSVQEVRSKKGDLKSFSLKDGLDLKSDQIAGLAMFDCMTLNSDRHGGNILLDPEGNLVPIDHGESLVEPNPTGLERLRLAMGGPHNILLSLPGAHVPLSKKMAQALAGMRTTGYGTTLSEQNKTVGELSPGTKGLVTDEALKISERAAKFVKLAAQWEPPLSPATIQLALASAPEDLLDPKIKETTFKKKAQKTIAYYAQHGDTIREVLLAPDIEWNTLKAKAEELGWSVAARRDAPPDMYCVSDPIALLSICVNEIKAPELKLQSQAIVDLHKSEKQLVSGEQAMTEICANRLKTMRNLLDFCDEKMQKKFIGAIEQLQQKFAKEKDSQSLLKFAGRLLAEMMEAATGVQSMRLKSAMELFRIDEMVARNMLQEPPPFHLDAQYFLNIGDPITAADHITSLERAGKQGTYLQNALGCVAQKLKDFQKAYLVPDSNGGLMMATSNLKQGDPFKAMNFLENLRQKSLTTYYKNAAAHIEGELRFLMERFTIGEKHEYVVQIWDALKRNDLEATIIPLGHLAGNCRRCQLAPSKTGMLEFARRVGLPLDDQGFLRAIKAAEKGEPVQAIECWKELLKRLKENEFDLKPLEVVQQDMKDLLGGWEIPPEHQCVQEFQYACRDSNVFQALMWLDQLGRLVKAGVFEQKK